MKNAAEEDIRYIMEEIREEREFVACELKKYGVKVD